MDYMALDYLLKLLVSSDRKTYLGTSQTHHFKSNTSLLVVNCQWELRTILGKVKLFTSTESIVWQSNLIVKHGSECYNTSSLTTVLLIHDQQASDRFQFYSFLVPSLPPSHSLTLNKRHRDLCWTQVHV